MLADQRYRPRGAPKTFIKSATMLKFFRQGLKLVVELITIPRITWIFSEFVIVGGMFLLWSTAVITCMKTMAWPVAAVDGQIGGQKLDKRDRRHISLQL